MTKIATRDLTRPEPVQFNTTDLLEIKRIRDHAEKHPATSEQLKALLAGRAKPFHLRPDFRCDICNGFICAFNYEQESDGTLRRHLFLDVDNEKNPELLEITPPELAQQFMDKFDFDKKLSDYLGLTATNKDLIVFLDNRYGGLHISERVLTDKTTKH